MGPEPELPGPPLRFFAPGGQERTRTGHLAPPVLDADGPAIRAWLGQQDPARPAPAAPGTVL